MGELKKFKMTKANIQRLVKKLATNSSNITFVNNCTDGEWERAVNFRQMLVCLQQGEVLSNPEWDEETNSYRFKMERLEAGQDIVLDIAIVEEQHLYVINVCQ